MILEQYFDVLSTARHKGMKVLLRVHHQDENIKVWENWNAVIHEVENNEFVWIQLGEDGPVIKVERDTIKLID